MQNLATYKKDLEHLVAVGERLHLAMRVEYDRAEIDQIMETIAPEKKKTFEKSLQELSPFRKGYQAWYSEARALVRQLLPDRLDDFSDYYEKPKTRKTVDYETYRISDYLLGLSVTIGFGTEVGPEAAIPKFRQQLEIVKAIRQRLKSALFDIQKTVQADLFDSELEGAKALIKHGFLRAGGIIAGVVLERHLAHVCDYHGLKIRKKAPTIGDFNDMLKNNGVIDIPQWRFNQYLGDIRNLCGHNKARDPTKNEAIDLVDGAKKVTKTLF
ncbi:MAG: hypothetical protein OXN89_10250 [Bryobacterales bacterium]|nr:hypothetical protein [Bryobacterales bacterium]